MSPISKPLQCFGGSNWLLFIGFPKVQFSWPAKSVVIFTPTFQVQVLKNISFYLCLLILFELEGLWTLNYFTLTLVRYWKEVQISMFD